jgi:hypothetical protein
MREKQGEAPVPAMVYPGATFFPKGVRRGPPYIVSVFPKTTIRVSGGSSHYPRSPYPLRAEL